MSERKCKCSTVCKFIITEKNRLEEIEDDEKSSTIMLRRAKKSIHCHTCLTKIKNYTDKEDSDEDSNSVLENEGDYFLCIPCRRESPTCEYCNERAVEPDENGNWKNKCISC